MLSPAMLGSAGRGLFGLSMAECIFTLDYELHGDGSGDLRDSVLEPAERLVSLFGLQL